MTLRRLLSSLAADDAARDELMSDPGAVLARAGFEGLGDELLGTALVHHVDTAPVDELDALVPLLERFAPIPGLARATTPDPDASVAPEPSVDADGHIDIGIDIGADPGRLVDGLDDDASVDRAAGSTGSTVDAAPTAEIGVDPDGVADAAFGTGAIPIISSDTPPPADLSTPVEVPPPDASPSAVIPPVADLDIARPHADADPPTVDPPTVDPPTVADDLDALD